MADMLPDIQMDINAAGTPVVVVEQVEVTDRSEALRLAPALGDPRWIRVYSRVVNHLAHGDDYDPIMDPEAFEAQYMEAYNAEDPNEEVGPGVVRLHNYPLPDFSAIHPPRMEGDILVFYAENLFLGLPYRVTMAPGAEPEYLPGPMEGDLSPSP